MSTPRTAFSIRDVTQRDFCIGCGGCSIATEGSIPITLSRDGQYRAGDLSEHAEAVSGVCPFSDDSPTEDDLAAPRYAEHCSYTTAIGYHRALYAGRVLSDDYRLGSSSGGLVSFVAGALLSSGAVDGIIHVKRTSTDEADQPLFAFGISTTLEELRAHRKSVYYPVEFSQALASAQRAGGRYVFIGIPCHVRALRLLQQRDPELSELVPYTIGLVCGHMKTTGFAESLGWQLGIEPANLRAVDFRVKDRVGPANRYATSATDRAGRTRTKKTFEMLGTNWGHGFFQPKACNVCDDIFAETADIAFGDAWLPRYASDPLGHNVVVVRNPELHELLLRAEQADEVFLEELSEEDTLKTQSGNVRHRRIGVEVRLADDIAAGLPVPHKRVEPGYEHADDKRVALIRRRRALSELSISSFLEAREKNSWRHFLAAIGPSVKAYDAQGAQSRLARILAPLPLSMQLRLRTVLMGTRTLISRLRRK
ncbi:Coenzyme F420 hydrogenase/dehydrogenase, beta subunit C-terminal domain [Corynebacterium sp. TAE3-ERU2]|uniref:Coenzyme F420 hydrogenase/dehydrogenase, beta subunit C-terminal domain n=1 Tax=Corynebacterium sp. TAE3-ERU2 TaxID=2849497 RepID=UPI001C47B8E6|nr:Coenzyme F420 hydrogenase/dehydrogenase, beta subunit C-terminal domain [Corynebacterium sp. TAE3-ERU2]MBV7301766.1 Coenzyme F420 hydrogenase/dehydrogenase, beta subunit C-terminal domain [Corynebacterium sp. TAE3-ERU2]